MIVRLFSVLSCESKERKEKKNNGIFFPSLIFTQGANISAVCVPYRRRRADINMTVKIFICIKLVCSNGLPVVTVLILMTRKSTETMRN